MGRLGAGHREADQLGGRDQPSDPLGPLDLELVTGAEVRAARDLPLDRVDEGGVGVPEEQRAVPHPVVDVLAAVDVPLAGTRRPLDVERERREIPTVVRDAAGDHASGALPARPRTGQGLPISLAHRLPHHAVSSSRAAAVAPRRVLKCPTSPRSVSSSAWCRPSGKSVHRGPRDAGQPVHRSRPDHRPGQPRLLRGGVEQDAARGQRQVRHHAPGAPSSRCPATTRWSVRTTEAILAPFGTSRTTRARTRPMPISLPPSPTPIVTVPARRRRKRASSGALIAADRDRPARCSSRRRWPGRAARRPPGAWARTRATAARAARRAAAGSAGTAITSRGSLEGAQARVQERRHRRIREIRDAGAQAAEGAPEHHGPGRAIRLGRPGRRARRTRSPAPPAGRRARLRAAAAMAPGTTRRPIPRPPKSSAHRVSTGSRTGGMAHQA